MDVEMEKEADNFTVKHHEFFSERLETHEPSYSCHRDEKYKQWLQTKK